MRRRVSDLIRGALASQETREQFVRGVLTDEIETTGFDAFAGMSIPAASRRRPRTKSAGESRRAQRARDELRKEIAATKEELEDAERRIRDATKQRDRLAAKLILLEEKDART